MGFFMPVAESVANGLLLAYFLINLDPFHSHLILSFFSPEKISSCPFLSMS